MHATILLLSSDADIRRVIGKALESEGYTVLAANDIGDAVNWIKACTPDLLMIRHYTESMSGHDAAMYLRTRCHGVPVLLVGGLMDDAGLENREIINGFEIFPKPFQPAELLEVVKRVLARSASQTTAHRNATN